MDWWWWLIIGLIVAPAIGGVVHTSARKSAFAELGDIRGMPIADIVTRVGEPNSISAASDGQLYQWIQNVGGSATHYAILVDHEGLAVGFTHQYSS